MYTTGYILKTEADLDNAVFFQFPVRVEYQVGKGVWEEINAHPRTIVGHSRFCVYLSAGATYVKPNYRFIVK